MDKNIIDNFVAPPCSEKIEILYEDEYMLVINKPSGLLSLSGKNPKNKDSVHYRLVKDYPTVTLAHRLDFGTSGVMLLAKNKQVNAKLTQQFQARSVNKGYESILAGHLRNEEGVIDLPIAKDAALFPRLKICNQEGKEARSKYKVLERLTGPSRTRVKFTPLTGRTHQLRLHSQAIGHPILGCDLYGSVETQGLASRLLLHALDITIKHPHSQKLITFTSPSPF
ncbi:RluA family pseudouridine synthase [Paraglaciecola marina]|uniref:RluA family pseudouridine synthase n=1 Tax=Paraglaciecola marina TaxID=2500157 RepID=UPI00105F6130|nr:RluA family pseudouridine synthase [Paraglaciecola marina]